MREVIIIHYDEIGTKGKNRDFFEKTLVKNIKDSLGNNIKSVNKIYGKIIAVLLENHSKKKIIEILSHTPGIAYFALGIQSDLNLDKIKTDTAKILKKQHSKNFQTFRITAKRSNKNLPVKSNDINNKLGEFIKNELKKAVNLSSPDLEIFIEISEKNSYIYIKKYRGIGGLPVGTTGTLISSLSGGIDSPVASYLMMKRGAKIIFAHIYNKTINKEATLSKIEKIVSALTQYQNSSKLYIIPFEEIQKQIIENIPGDYRMIIYRRFMNKIQNKIAQRENAKAIITGDNLGQVASQTPENIHCIYSSSDIPIFSPLIGLNKQEIINIAKQISTYNLSILPYEDCCSFMIDKHPATKASLEKTRNYESKIQNHEELINNAIKNANVKEF